MITPVLLWVESGPAVADVIHGENIGNTQLLAAIPFPNTGPADRALRDAADEAMTVTDDFNDALRKGAA